MAPDACSAATSWFHWIWLVLQILDLLLIFLANVAAVHCLLGRHIQGRGPMLFAAVMPVMFTNMVMLCVLTPAFQLQDPHKSRILNAWADDLACALFGMANSVTAMFYLIDATTGKDALVEGGEIERPPWLGFSANVFNTIVAWADLCCAHPRSFSKRSGRLSVGIIAFYTVWILICSHFNGAFPYPILNQLPWPAVSAAENCLLSL